MEEIKYIHIEDINECCIWLLYAMKYLMKVSNVQDVHFYVVQSVLIIIILLIIIIVQFVGIKKSIVLYT